jgi:tetratricopeptide (TPR) repeat protein
VDPVDSRVIADPLDRRQTVAEDVDADELIDVGLSYMGIQRYEQAVDTFDRVAQFTDDDSVRQEAWVNKGAAHAELEEWEAAIDSYREALYIDAEGEHAAAAETNLAYALWEDGRTEQALEHAENAVQLDSRNPQAWYNRGFFLLERGLAEEAVNAFENAQRLGFRSPELLEELARAYEKTGQEERAEELVDEAEEVRQQREEEMVR